MLAYKALYKKMMDDLKDAGMWIDWAEQIEEEHPTIAKFLLESAKERLEESARSGIEPRTSIDTLAAMCAGGTAVTIYMWLMGGKKKSPDELADEIGIIIKTMLS